MALRFTLVADGGSDKALVPIIEWVLQRIPKVMRSGFAIEFTTGTGGKSVHERLAAKIDVALREFPCDLLFVHRDAEAEPARNRHDEIDAAITELDTPPIVPIIPIRMTEAWLLIDVAALRKAADNPNGNVQVDLPAVQRLEELPDPKQLCGELLIRASEKTGRRQKKFNRPAELAWRRVRLAQLIADFSPLLRLSAFAQFYQSACDACERLPT